MAKVIIGIGVPGSGKTTILKDFAEKYGYAYLCPDDIRAEHTGDAKNQTRNQEVWDEARRRVESFLTSGRIVVFDATFADERTRSAFLAFVRKHGAEKIQGIFIDAPLETAKERNAKRDRIVPEYVVERMYDNLSKTPPQIDEGFDTLFTLDEYHALARAEQKNHESVIRKEFRIK